MRASSMPRACRRNQRSHSKRAAFKLGQEWNGCIEMTVILNNDEITKLLPMAQCLAQLDEAYRELGEGRAISRPRSDIYGPLHDNGEAPR